MGVARANLEQARAEAREAEANLARSKDLAEKNYISGSTLDSAIARADKARAAVRSGEAALNAAQANLKAAEVALDQTLIRAPFDGVVLTKSANVGDNITPFSSAADTKGAVVTIADMETLEVEADVAESSLGKVKVGQPCEIQLDALSEQRFAGVVQRIVPTVDRAKATVLVKIRFVERDPRVVPDMAAKVALSWSPSAGSTIASRCIRSPSRWMRTSRAPCARTLSCSRSGLCSAASSRQKWWICFGPARSARSSSVSS